MGMLGKFFILGSNDKVPGGVYGEKSRKSHGPLPKKEVEPNDTKRMPPRVHQRGSSTLGTFFTLWCSIGGPLKRGGGGQQLTKWFGFV